MQPPDAAGMLHPHTVKASKGKKGGKQQDAGKKDTKATDAIKKTSWRVYKVTLKERKLRKPHRKQTEKRILVVHLSDAVDRDA